MTDSVNLVTLEELRKNNGDRGSRIWIVHNGTVYDVTEAPRWRSGLHEELHFGGQDLSSEFPDAPHGVEVFLHPGVRPIGRLLAR